MVRGMGTRYGEGGILLISIVRRSSVTKFDGIQVCHELSPKP